MKRPLSRSWVPIKVLLPYHCGPKGVGVYFITQNPADVPDSVLAQLGNRVQHALRAFTPRDQKAVRAAAQTFRANPAMDTESVISELRTGEALVSFLCSVLELNAECLGGASHPRRALTRGKSGLQSQLVGNIQFKPCLTLLSFHKVLLSRIHKNEIRLVDLDLISSALQLKRFSVNSLTTCTVPCAWIWP